MLHLSSKLRNWFKTRIQPLKLTRFGLVSICLASFFMVTSLIYALPLTGSDNNEVPESDSTNSVFENLFVFRNTNQNNLSIKIKDPTGASSDPGKALSNQFEYANGNKLHSFGPGDNLDFSYEITNTGTDAIDIRETYYILSFDKQNPTDLDYAMFRSVAPLNSAGALKGTSALPSYNLDGKGHLFSFTSDPYTLSGSRETISGASRAKRSECYMVLDYYSGNETQGDTILIITTLEYKDHDNDEWGPTITDTVIVGGGTSSMEYRKDTDVYFSCDIAALDYVNPDNPGYVTFTVTDQNGSVTTLTYDDFASPILGIQRAYVPFHIPNREGDLTVSISCSDNLVCDTKEIIATVVNSDEKTPPDPTLSMDISNFGVFPSFKDSEHHDWVTYSAYKNEAGEWEYQEHAHTASLNLNFLLTPDSNVKTAVGSTLGSGYGVNAEITSDISQTSPDDPLYNIQNVYCFFPEFNYTEYFRKLEKTAHDDLSNTWEFRVNKYSHSNSRAHYIPPAFPDGLYTVFAFVRDAWTPVGELKGSVTAEVNIVGSLYDDWYISPID